MAFTRSGIPLWIYYQEKTPISNLDDIKEDSLYFMMNSGEACEVVYVREKNVEKKTITVQTLEEKIEKKIDLNLFKYGKLKFYENEIDP